MTLWLNPSLPHVLFGDTVANPLPICYVTLEWPYIDIIFNLIVLSACVTVGGPSRGRPCIFPFKYNKVTYNACTEVHSPEGLWCSTKVGSDGVTIKDNWGLCKPGC
jgi:hypothetical protein